MEELPNPLPESRLPFINPPALTEKSGRAMFERIGRWKYRDMWRLWEGCDLAVHVMPVRIVRQLWLYRIEFSNDLLDRAIRAVHAGILNVKETSGREATWWVRPSDFGRWAITQAHVIGADRTAVFEAQFPKRIPLSDPARIAQKILDSGYRTKELDAAFAAIAEFWLPVLDGAPYPNNKIVKDWVAKYFELEPSAAARVDRVIRLQEARGGGRKGATQKLK